MVIIRIHVCIVSENGAGLMGLRQLLEPEPVVGHYLPNTHQLLPAPHTGDTTVQCNITVI